VHLYKKPVDFEPGFYKRVNLFILKKIVNFNKQFEYMDKTVLLLKITD
jgi:hypothetical protein